jgi:NAD-dependent histone deacetylase SIR2
LLLNLEPAGTIGERTNDVVHLGECDSAVRELCDILGWRDELEAIWKRAGGGSKDKQQTKKEKNTSNTSNVRNTKDAGGSSEDNAKNMQRKSEDKSTEENTVEKTLERVIEDIQQTLIITPNSGTVKGPPVNVHDDQERTPKSASRGLKDQEHQGRSDETKKNADESSGSESTAQVPDLVQGEAVSASTLSQLVPGSLK